MLNFIVVNEMLLAAIDKVLGVLLRAVGGPARMPRRNEDFVWF
jgi:hypothetical protein